MSVYLTESDELEYSTDLVKLISNQVEHCNRTEDFSSCKSSFLNNGVEQERDT